jgi:hypothetical protein
MLESDANIFGDELPIGFGVGRFAKHKTPGHGFSPQASSKQTILTDPSHGEAGRRAHGLV